MTAEEKAADEAVDMTNCSLSKIILEHMDINKERDDRKREEKEEQEEEFDTDEEVGCIYVLVIFLTYASLQGGGG